MNSATRAATLARLREVAGFADTWFDWALAQNLATPAVDRINVETLVLLAYEIGRGDGIDQAAAILGKPREVA